MSSGYGISTVLLKDSKQDDGPLSGRWLANGTGPAHAGVHICMEGYYIGFRGIYTGVFGDDTHEICLG